MKYLSPKELLKNIKKLEGSKLDRDTAFWLGIIIILNAKKLDFPSEIFEKWEKECEEFASKNPMIKRLFERDEK